MSQWPLWVMDHGHVTPEARLSPISSPWNGKPDVIPRLHVTKAGYNADNEILLLRYGVSRPDVWLQLVGCPLSVACWHMGWLCCY